MLDEKDSKILQLLQNDGRMTNVDLARYVELTPSATLERVRKLEERGLIRGFAAQLNSKALNLGLVAFIYVRVETDVIESDSVAKAISKIPNVLEVHEIAGEDCLLVKVKARDTDDLYRMMKEEFGNLKQISSTRTTIVLHTIKETQSIPVPTV
ncbi:MAG: Lrp/AsnC family transcriptional regulator [Pyrinomonadaceae bacterium]